MMIEESKIEEITRFAFPRVTEENWEEKKRFVEDLFKKTPHTLRIDFYELCKDGLISDHEKCDEGVAYMGVLAHYDPKTPASMMRKGRLHGGFFAAALVGATLRKSRIFLEEMTQTSDRSDTLQECGAYLLERI